MLQRLATVIWWFGALLLAGFIATAFFFMAIPEVAWQGGVFGLIGIVCAVLCWSLTFILAGSFWRPPRKSLPPTVPQPGGYYYLQSHRDDR